MDYQLMKYVDKNCNARCSVIRINYQRSIKNTIGVDLWDDICVLSNINFPIPRVISRITDGLIYE